VTNSELILVVLLLLSLLVNVGLVRREVRRWRRVWRLSGRE
jgi:hypothetical protein